MISKLKNLYVWIFFLVSEKNKSCEKLKYIFAKFNI